MSSTISLYGIQSSLRQLIEFRRDVIADTDLPAAELAELLDSADKEIERYITAELGKVDAVAVVLRDLDELAVTRRQIANDEYERLKALAVRAEEDAGRLREAVIRAMEIGGVKRLEGRSNIFKIQRNPPAVEVVQPDLIPDEYRKISVTMPLELWSIICLEVSSEIEDQINNEVKELRPEPMKSEISKVLKPLAALQTDLAEVERAIAEAYRLGSAEEETINNLDARHDELKAKIAAQPGVPGARIRQTVRLVVE